MIRDPNIQVAVELMGGIHPAREVVLQLLESGKDVVTANKALLCEHGDEIFAAARRYGRTVCFEAAVAGGIPIIAAVGQSMAANQIVGIQAILNFAPTILQVPDGVVVNNVDLAIELENLSYFIR